MSASRQPVGAGESVKKGIEIPRCERRSARLLKRAYLFEVQSTKYPKWFDCHRASFARLVAGRAVLG
jgi:hypothetical protein